VLTVTLLNYQPSMLIRIMGKAGAANDEILIRIVMDRDTMA
jgi:hypothetical protein